VRRVLAPASLLVPRPRSVARLHRRYRLRHPELEAPVTWASAQAIAAREHITVRVRTLPGRETGRLVRLGPHVSIHLSRRLPEHDRASVMMHELCHYWSDDPGEMCYFNDEGEPNAVEEFCERFAWYCVDPNAREFLNRWREEGF